PRVGWRDWTGRCSMRLMLFRIAATGRKAYPVASRTGARSGEVDGRLADGRRRAYLGFGEERLDADRLFDGRSRICRQRTAELRRREDRREGRALLREPGAPPCGQRR